MKILLTCFEPFGGEALNSAQESVRLVPSCICGAEIVKLDVPVVFGKSIDTVVEAMSRELPDAVLCIGQAGGRTCLTPERVAVNIDDARMPDNDGNAPVDRPVIEGAPSAYFSSLPIKAMVRGMGNAGVPAAISNTAGTFVCNHLMYGVLHSIALSFPWMVGGFMHVPYMDQQVQDKPGLASLSVDTIALGIEEAVKAIVECMEGKG